MSPWGRALCERCDFCTDGAWRGAAISVAYNWVPAHLMTGIYDYFVCMMAVV